MCSGHISDFVGRKYNVLGSTWIGTEVVGLLWNSPFLEYTPTGLFLGYFFPSLHPLGHSCFLSLVYLTLSLVSVSCF